MLIPKYKAESDEDVPLQFHSSFFLVIKCRVWKYLKPYTIVSMSRAMAMTIIGLGSDWVPWHCGPKWTYCTSPWWQMHTDYWKKDE